MRTLEQHEARLQLYGDAKSLFFPGVGNVAWHFSTGDNIELLFLEAQTGCGIIMLCRMAKQVIKDGKLPYHSVFAFRLAHNDVAARFYDRLDWHQEDLGDSIYRGDNTVIMWITWKEFLKSLERFMDFDKDWSAS
jgi:hypothetical protein